MINEYDLKELIVASSGVTRDDLLAIFNKYGVAEDVNLRLSSGLYEIITTGLEVREIASVPLVNVNKVRLTGVRPVAEKYTRLRHHHPIINRDNPHILIHRVGGEA